MHSSRATGAGVLRESTRSPGSHPGESVGDSEDAGILEPSEEMQGASYLPLYFFAPRWNTRGRRRSAIGRACVCARRRRRLMRRQLRQRRRVKQGFILRLQLRRPRLHRRPLRSRLAVCLLRRQWAHRPRQRVRRPLHRPACLLSRWAPMGPAARRLAQPVALLAHRLGWRRRRRCQYLLRCRRHYPLRMGRGRGRLSTVLRSAATCRTWTRAGGWSRTSRPRAAHEAAPWLVPASSRVGRAAS